jgi:hypothetical protein
MLATNRGSKICGSKFRSIGEATGERKSLWMRRLEPLDQLVDAGPRLRRKLEYADSRAHALDVVVGRFGGEFDSLSQIHLRNHRGIRALEYGRIFQWFILAFRY